MNGLTTSLNGNGLRIAQAVAVHQKIDCPQEDPQVSAKLSSRSTLL
jgi:hypothetical protein